MLAIRSLLLVAVTLQFSVAQDIKEHPGRRERDTPGLVLETGARTAACDVLTFTLDGKHLLATGDDKVVRTWSVSADGALLLDTLPTLRWPIYREMRGNIYTAALSPDGDRLVVAGHGQRIGGFAAAIVDRITGEPLHAINNPGAVQQGNIWASGFSPAGTQVVLGTSIGAIWVWELKTGKLSAVGVHARQLPDAEFGKVRHVAFDGENRIVSVSGSGEMAQWDRGADGGWQKSAVHQFGGPIATPIVRSPDGKWLGAVLELTGQATLTVELVAFPNAAQKRTLSFGGGKEIPHRLAFSRTSQYLAVGVREVGNRKIDPGVTFFQERGGRVLIFDLTQAKPEPIPGPAQGLYAEGLAFHPTNDAWLAVAGGNDHDVTLWDWKAGHKLAEVSQPGRGLWSVALTPTGDAIGFQADRNLTAPHPNRRGQGDWQTFDLTTRQYRNTTPEFASPIETSASGWTVRTATPESVVPSRWFVVSPAGKSFELPLSRVLDEFPRCYVFLPPATANGPDRLVVGHYWGASVFALTDAGPVRTRVLRGHEGYVTALAATADGKRVVSASRDMTLAGWGLDDWPYHSKFGAEFFVRAGKLIVGKIAPGSPVWEMGFEPGDEIVGLTVATDDPKASPVVYDRYSDSPVGTPEATLTALVKGGQPDVEHVFYWKTPTIPAISVGVTTLVDRPLWRFFPQANREWVLWRWRDYYYDCSIRGDSTIGWQRSYPFAAGGVLRKPDFFRAEQFRQEFLKPDKIAETLATWQSDPTPVRFNEIEPPTVTLSEPVPTADGFAITVTATPRGTRENQAPARVLVWLNDHRLVDRKLTELPADGVYRETVRIPAGKLRTGANAVIAQCYGKGGARADGSPQTIAGPTTPRPRTLHSLLVGVGDYRATKPKPQIPLGADADAKVIADAILAQTGRGTFAVVKPPKLLSNIKATRDGILSALDALAADVGPDDLLVFHLGGHGTSLDRLQKTAAANPGLGLQLAGLDRFLFLCPDFDFGRLQTTTVGFEDLHDRLAGLACHKLVLLDACHSGEAQTAGGDTDANPVRILTRHGIGSAILAACGPGEAAIENGSLDPIRGGKGLFTIAVCKLFEDADAFDAADRDKNKFLDTSEFARGIDDQLKSLLAEHNTQAKALGRPADRQTPVLIVPRSEERVPVAKTP